MMVLLLAKTYIIRQLIDITGLMRKMFLQLEADDGNPLDQAFCEPSFPEMIEQDIFNVIPEISRDYCIDAFVTDNGEPAVFKREIKQHAIPSLCFLHAQFAENVGSPVHDIFFAPGFNVDADFPGSIQFGIQDSLPDIFLLFARKKIFGNLDHDEWS